MLGTTSSTEPNALAEATATQRYKRIDHVAFAVRDLESAITLFGDVLGFSLVRRLTIRGKKTGMISAEFEHNGIKFVLCQGTEPESQVSQLIDSHGPGVAHIALEVDDPHEIEAELQKRGLAFDTSVIEGPGLTQVFSSRCANSGAAFEFICRTSEEGFLEENVQQLFEQLESSGKY
jgi:4-hydroxyphenylpyruvate dioxygenase-like putative hemolysin